MGESRRPASGIFACNVDAVEATAKQLGRVFDELQNFDRRDDAHASDLASAKIQHALHEFYTHSSDQRKKIKDSVQGLHDMLNGLVQGVRDIDKALTDSLPDAPPAPQLRAVPAAGAKVS